MKLNLKKPLLDSSGKALEYTLSGLLSDSLMSSPAKPPLSTKYFIWGLELAKSGILEVDEADHKSLKEFIDTASLTILVHGRLSEVIDVPFDKKKE